MEVWSEESLNARLRLVGWDEGAWRAGEPDRARRAREALRERRLTMSEKTRELYDKQELLMANKQEGWRKWESVSEWVEWRAAHSFLELDDGTEDFFQDVIAFSELQEKAMWDLSLELARHARGFCRFSGKSRQKRRKKNRVRLRLVEAFKRWKRGYELRRRCIEWVKENLPILVAPHTRQMGDDPSRYGRGEIAHPQEALKSLRKEGQTGPVHLHEGGIVIAIMMGMCKEDVDVLISNDETYGEGCRSFIPSNVDLLRRSFGGHEELSLEGV